MLLVREHGKEEMSEDIGFNSLQIRSKDSFRDVVVSLQLGLGILTEN